MDDGRIPRYQKGKARHMEGEGSGDAPDDDGEEEVLETSVMISGKKVKIIFPHYTKGTEEWESAIWARKAKCDPCKNRTGDCIGHKGYASCLRCKRQKGCCSTNGIGARVAFAIMSRAGDIPYSPNDDFDRSREFPKLTALAIARVRAEHSSKSDDSHSPAAPPQGPVAGPAQGFFGSFEAKPSFASPLSPPPPVQPYWPTPANGSTDLQLQILHAVIEIAEKQRELQAGIHALDSRQLKMRGDILDLKDYVQDQMEKPAAPHMPTNLIVVSPQSSPPRPTRASAGLDSTQFHFDMGNDSMPPQLPLWNSDTQQFFMNAGQAMDPTPYMFQGPYLMDSDAADVSSQAQDFQEGMSSRAW